MKTTVASSAAIWPVITYNNKHSKGKDNNTISLKNIIADKGTIGTMLPLNNHNRMMIYYDIMEDHDNSHPSFTKPTIKLWPRINETFGMLPSELHIKTKACT